MILKERYRKFLKLWADRINLKKHRTNYSFSTYIDIFIERTGKSLLHVVTLYEGVRHVGHINIGVPCIGVPCNCELPSVELKYCIGHLLDNGLRERIKD